MATKAAQIAPLYGTITVTYRDGTEQTYVTYMSHLVQYELQYGDMTAATGAASTARLAHLVSESTEPFEDWLKRIAFVTVPPAPDGGSEATEPVPTA